MEMRKSKTGEKPSLLRRLDDQVQALFARQTDGVSPVAYFVAAVDWAAHSALQPGRSIGLASRAMGDASRFWAFVPRALMGSGSKAPVEPDPKDRRFTHAGWQRFPYNVYQQAYLIQEGWWKDATRGVRGVAPHHERLVRFAADQSLEALAPTNFPLTNPEVIERSVSEKGANLVRGIRHLTADTVARVRGKPSGPSGEFELGRDLAATPGKVVYRNELLELIQYTPSTERVYAEPVLVVPAWIMKYYILDLAPGKSFIEFLVSQGHTVFCISWKNPTEADRDLRLDDYRTSGVMAALNAISGVVPEQKIHAVGYCLGGTLLSIAAATMARDGDERLASMSLLAAQTDFQEAGEIRLFIDEAQLSVLESSMRRQGYLEGEQMAAAFKMLRSRDLIWSTYVQEYLLGERMKSFDLMAWNSDATRMPYRMHAEYLRTLYLHNDLARGDFLVGGREISVGDIRVPVFCLGAEYDHVAPWPSVYRLLNLTRTEVTFCLTNGGHNSGVVSEVGHPRRRHRLAKIKAGEHVPSADAWFARHEPQAGSWWKSFEAWLSGMEGQHLKEPPVLGGREPGLQPIEDAPGQYVLG